MDPGTPSRPPDYYLGYTGDSDSHGAHDSLTGAATTQSHTTSTNPAAVRLLTSMDGGGTLDDDALTPPSLRTSGAQSLHRGSISAVPPQLPEIRPLGSSTSKVAAAVSTLEQREQRKRRQQREQCGRLQEANVPPFGGHEQAVGAPHKTVKFVQDQCLHESQSFIHRSAHHDATTARLIVLAFSRSARRLASLNFAYAAMDAVTP
ncbi:hypothetical protein SPBR_02973 [Sporothrix brasiliensis 5110]|uniref:Uncharacterized protein n=1 Tax=Sporothrix brasiliensis 5110 TaxID=1398154 RepID=A0A0C2J5F2_9PEZI|nr:uncharacterized protein SPBR_02973 [Sporothrix brasiliensis 5110]KIH92277.1 hypothetical protein SPBR_02973 [Sporothrix brasiliensis 5110]